MPDDETTEQPTKRLTTAEAARAAQDAMALATAADERLDEISEKLTDLQSRMADREVAHAELRDDMSRRLADDNPVTHALAEDALSDQLDAMIGPKLANVLARLEEVERQLAGVESGEAAVAGSFAADLTAVKQKVVSLARVAGPAIIDSRIAEALEPIGASISELALQLVDVRRALEAVGDAAPALAQPAPTGLGAARKVLALMRQVGEIPKSQKADLGKGGRFQFRGVDQAMDAVGAAMRTIGLIYSPRVLTREQQQSTVKSESTYQGKTTVRDTVWTTVFLTVEYTFTDPEDGSTHTFQMVGEGRDAGDKATSKAAAMALKYGLLHGLMIPVEGMPDGDADNNNHLTQERSHERPPADHPARTDYEENRHDMPPVSVPAPASEAGRQSRAVAALHALRALNGPSVPPAQRLERLNAIAGQLKTEQLSDYVIEGATLRAHCLAVGRTLEAGEPPMNDEGAGEYH